MCYAASVVNGSGIKYEWKYEWVEEKPSLLAEGRNAYHG